MSTLAPNLSSQKPALASLTDLEKIRVCHVQVLPLLSGVQRVMLQIFSVLDRDRYQPWVICRDEGPLTEALQDLSIPYTLVPSLDRPVHPVRDLTAYRELRRIFTEQQFDIVHTHSSKPGILARIAAKRSGTPHVLHHVHGFGFNEFSPFHQKWLYSRLERIAGRFCDRVIFVNHEDRLQSIDSGMLPSRKCLTVNNGVDLAALDRERQADVNRRFRSEHGFDPHETLIVFSGRLEPQKQPEILPRIAAELERLRPDAAWRIVVSGTGALESALRAGIRERALEHRLQLIGWQPDPYPLFLAGDIVLHPTLWEGLPLTLIEGQAASLPAVAGNVKGNREVITQETGILCGPRDAAAFANRLAELLDDPVQRAAMGAAARRRAESFFDGPHNARQVLALYESLAGLTHQLSKLQNAA